MPVAIIIGAVVAAGAAITGAVISSNDVDEANRIGLQTYNQEQKDKKKLTEEQTKINNFTMGMEKKKFQQGVKEFRQGVKEREKDRQYTKREKFKADNLNFVNQNAQLRNVFLNSVRRG